MTREKWEQSVTFAVTEGKVDLVIIDDDDEDLVNLLPSLPTLQFVRVSTLPSKGSSGSGAKIPPAMGGSDFPMLRLLSGGSTGSPKLYSIPHSVVLSELVNYPLIVGPVENPRVLQQSPAVWPASCFGQINIALALAGTIVITREKKPELLMADIVRQRVTVLGGAPSQLSSLVDYSTPESQLSVVLTWGEPLPASIGHRIRQTIPECLLIELLVATEYWLSLFCRDSSGEFETVPDCRIEIVDADAAGVGQLSLSGPMVTGDGDMLTQDLVKRNSRGRIEFVGRKDFLTKIGGNWFDVRVIERAVVEVGQEMAPCINEAVVVARGDVHYLFLSVEVDMLPCDVPAWIEQLKALLGRISPIQLEVRTVSTPLPKVANTGKTDRRAIVSQLDSVIRKDDSLDAVGIARFDGLLKKQLKWTIGFAVLANKYVLAVPYMYLVTLYMPFADRTEYLPRGNARSSVVVLLDKLTSNIRKFFPFGTPGFMMLLIWLRNRNRRVKIVVRVWTLLGIWLAHRGGRLTTWPVAFWAGAGSTIKAEGEEWLKKKTWSYLLYDIRFLVRSVPDAILGTNFCGKLKNPRPYGGYYRQSGATTPADDGERALSIADEDEGIRPPLADNMEVESTDIPRPAPTTDAPMSPEDDWWKNSPVEYIRLGNGGRRPPPTLASAFELVDSDDSIETFVVQSLCSLGLKDRTASLRGISSLQVTELVQKLRHRVPTISARIVMDSGTVDELLTKVSALLAEPDQSVPFPTEPQLVRIQYSAGQVGHYCRWILRTKGPVDEIRLTAALEGLVARHPLLRSELEDPKAVHSFIYDAGVTVVNAHRAYGSGRFLSFVSRCVHSAWARTRIYPPGQSPSHWSFFLNSEKDVKVLKDFQKLGEEIRAMRIDLERESWYNHQSPLMANVFTLRPTGQAYIVLSIKHSVSDGNSAFPLMDELAMLYDQAELPPPVNPIPELETRLRDGLTVAPFRPNRTSLRTTMFYSDDLEENSGGSYRHYVVFEPGTIRALRQVASGPMAVGFDSLLLSVIYMSLMRADYGDTETLTLYCPMRDGPGESSFIGLLSDWRDLTIKAVPGATVLDVVNEVARRVRDRLWEPTLSPAGPERVLLNWMPFDGTPRLKDKSWEPFHTDALQNWGRIAHEITKKAPLRARSLSFEQYEPNGQWWLRFDVAMNFYPPAWMMRFVEAVNSTCADILNNPLVPLAINDSSE